ncbi:MAG: prenyltransferase/squalene oxidase repeat-containing protein [Opitutales bacterium]
MKTKNLSLLLLVVVAMLPSFGYSKDVGESAPSDPANLSLRNEVRRAVSRGVNWLAGKQEEEGRWGDEEYPALTALAVRAILAEPVSDNRHQGKLDKGIAFVLSKAQSDGGIYGRGLASYNTSICMMALLQNKDPKHEPIIRKARNFLVNQQSDFDRRGKADNVFDGGIGYGARWAHSDLSNSHLAMEALFYSKKMLAPREGQDFELDWDAAINFVARCQNLPGKNKQEWVSSDPDDWGGFIYFPGSSMAGERELADGRKVLRSYGSMSYAGLLSFIYAEMKADDERVQAAREWINAHYSVEENPGMGEQGLFYYYHTMAKALDLSGVKLVEKKDGTKANWRRDLAKKLFDLQQADGSWLNKNGRWWERDPVLVTAYALLTLERIYYGL